MGNKERIHRLTPMLGFIEHTVLSSPSPLLLPSPPPPPPSLLSNHHLVRADTSLSKAAKCTVAGATASAHIVTILRSGACTKLRATKTTQRLFACKAAATHNHFRSPSPARHDVVLQLTAWGAYFTESSSNSYSIRVERN